MIPLHMFIEQHKDALVEKYKVEYAENIESGGTERFRDYSDCIDDCHKLAMEAFGIPDDDNAGDAIEEVFDLFADYTYELFYAVESDMLLEAFPGLHEAVVAKQNPTRRAEEVLYECADLMAKKGAAYNGFPQAEYYPYGLRDIWYMCWTKVKRLESQIIRDGEPNFEGVEDSARDLINYAAFLVEYSEGKMDGQDKNKV